MWIAIATWPFGTLAVRAAQNTLQYGGSSLDAAVAGAQAVEDDPTVNSVGLGGLGDANGNVTLDASVMDGATLNCGAVASVSDVRHVTTLARRVMERTNHVLLVGDGARQFAIEQGFPLDILHTPLSIEQWNKTRPKPGDGPQNLPDPSVTHDTVTVMVRDAKGKMGGACSTSGLAHKRPGRVGDSPLIGHGLYVDDEAGAAGATGVGEESIRINGSFMIVELMRNGASAQAACEEAARRVNAAAMRRGQPPGRIAFMALDRHGKPGAAATRETNFQYAVATEKGVELVQAIEL